MTTQDSKVTVLIAPGLRDVVAEHWQTLLAAQLPQGGCLPVPRQALPMRSLVAASRNDPLGRIERIAELAARWGSEWFDLGEVGHLNPASGHGDWPLALTLLEQLRTRPAALHGL